MSLKLAFAALCFALLFLSLVVVCRAQTNANGSFTNGSTVLTISNGVVVSTIPISAEPVLVSTNGEVIPSALTMALATELGLPPSLLAAIPIKYLFWLGMFVVVLPAVAKKVIKFVPADWLANSVGVAISHLADVKNPTVASLSLVAKQVENARTNPVAADSPIVPAVVANIATPQPPQTVVVPIDTKPAAPIIKP